MKNTKIINTENFKDFKLSLKKLISEYTFDEINQDSIFIGIPKWSIIKIIKIEGNYKGYNFVGELNEVSKWHDYEVNNSFDPKELYEILNNMITETLNADFFYELSEITNEKFIIYFQGDEVTIKNILWDKSTPQEIKANFEEFFHQIEETDQLEYYDKIFTLIEYKGTFFSECIFELTLKNNELRNGYKLIWEKKANSKNK
jgi:hypothetical protein